MFLAVGFVDLGPAFLEAGGEDAGGGRISAAFRLSRRMLATLSHDPAVWDLDPALQHGCWAVPGKGGNITSVAQAGNVCGSHCSAEQQGSWHGSSHYAGFAGNTGRCQWKSMWHREEGNTHA